MPYQPKAIRHFRVTPTELTYIQSITASLTKPDYKLFCHILSYTLRHQKRLEKRTVPDSKFQDGGWIGIHSRHIKDWFPDGKPQRLKDNGLIEVYGKYKPGMLTCQYRITPDIFKGLAEALAQSEGFKLTHDLVTGKPWQDKWDKYSSDGRENIPKTGEESLTLYYAQTPPLVTQAINSIRQCHYDRPALSAYLEQAQADYKTNPSDSNPLRFLNDFNIFRELPTHSPFQPEYHPQLSGRISTPMQNLTREAKQASYASIPDIHNYDLSSAHPRICNFYEFPRHGINCEWLREYLENPEARQSYAAHIGITPEAFKEALIGVMMGARLPRSADDRQSSILPELKAGMKTGSSKEEINATLHKFNDTISELRSALNKWHTAILKQLEKDKMIPNRLNIPLKFEDIADRGSRKGKIAAHILQGAEALFIHTLTTLADKHGFEPIGNEHDGLITIGEIPEVAIQEARERTDLHHLELREKPFC